jgi:esterase/lipase superfamily enzyme
MGYRIGMAMVERLSRDVARLPTELENVKFICKDFWTNVFGKQVDNLRTNHQVCGILICAECLFRQFR